LLVINFGVRGLNGVLAFVLLDFFPQFLDGSGNDSLSFIGFVDFSVVNLLFASHGIGFSGASLTICEDGGAVAFNCGVNKPVNIALFVAHLLGVVLVKEIIEFVAFINASW
jgi:hypothetical protein